MLVRCLKGVMELSKLKGKQIKSIQINSDKTALKFELAGAQGTIAYYTDGDCCSRSWIEHFSGIENLLDGVIEDATEILIGTYDRGEPEYGFDSHRFYGVKIKTTTGYSDLEYRNASNGYYGGSLREVEESEWGEYSVKDLKSETFVDLKEDF